MPICRPAITVDDVRRRLLFDRRSGRTYQAILPGRCLENLCRDGLDSCEWIVARSRGALDLVTAGQNLCLAALGHIALAITLVQLGPHIDLGRLHFLDDGINFVEFACDVARVEAILCELVLSVEEFDALATKVLGRWYNLGLFLDDGINLFL